MITIQGSQSIALALLAMAAVRADAASPGVFSVQDDAEIRAMLDKAGEVQSRSTNQPKAFHKFAFSDRRPESGITFEHRMTEDSGRSEKAVHYDHGSALALADVDGDGLPDIYFANQIGGNQLWRNLGGGRFENITSQAGVEVAGKISVGAAFADLDNDGDPDLIVSTTRLGNVLFENLGAARFRDVTVASGLKSQHHASGIVVFDPDRDGLADIFITSTGRFTTDTRGADGRFVAMEDAFRGHLHPERSEPCQLFRNHGGLKFTEVASNMGITNTGWSGDAVACDINEDGFPDLHVLNMQGDDHLFVNIDGKRFEDQTSKYFPKTPWGAMGIAVFDFNLDGRLDFFTTDMHSDMTGGQGRLRKEFNSAIEKAKSEAWCTAQWNEAFLQGSSNNIFGNAFYRNLGNGKFEEVSDKLGIETYWPWGISIGDLNADGYEDVLVTGGMGYPFPYGINSLLLNEAGEGFKAAEFLLGLEPRRGKAVSKQAFTLDCDGADRNHRLCREHKGKLAVEASLSTRSAVIVDLDEDGDLDIVTNEFDGPPQLLLSNLEERHKPSFIKIQLTGTRSNRDGLGALIRVRTGTTVSTRYHTAKSGYLAQSSLPLYFGLGTAGKVDEITVLWPSGRKQRLGDGIPLNGLLKIEEPRTE